MQNDIKREGVTLEPTPPSTRICTTINKRPLPTKPMQILIPKIYDQIHQSTSQYNKNIINYLSDYTLTEDEFSVLTKDLSFVSTPTKTLKQEMNKSCNKFKTRVLKQYFFCDNIHDKPLLSKRNASWIPSPPDNPTLVDFFTSIEQELTSINTSCRKAYGNVTLRKR